MNPRENGVWQLAVVAVCLLLADWLPAAFKLWFVEESGNISTGYFWSVLLIIGLFRRWRPALALTFIYSGLQLWAAYFALSHNMAGGGKTLGWLLTGALYMTVVLLLFFSRGVNRYVRARPTAVG